MRRLPSCHRLRTGARNCTKSVSKSGPERGNSHTVNLNGNTMLGIRLIQAYD